MKKRPKGAQLVSGEQETEPRALDFSDWTPSTTVAEDGPGPGGFTTSSPLTETTEGRNV